MIAPHAAPTPMPTTKASTIEMCGLWVNISPTVNAESPSVEPTDRSTLRVMITIASPTASSM